MVRWFRDRHDTEKASPFPISWSHATTTGNGSTLMYINDDVKRAAEAATVRLGPIPTGCVGLVTGTGLGGIAAGRDDELCPQRRGDHPGQ